MCLTLKLALPLTKSTHRRKLFIITIFYFYLFIYFYIFFSYDLLAVFPMGTNKLFKLKRNTYM